MCEPVVSWSCETAVLQVPSIHVKRKDAKTSMYHSVTGYADQWWASFVLPCFYTGITIHGIITVHGITVPWSVLRWSAAAKWQVGEGGITEGEILRMGECFPTPLSFLFFFDKSISHLISSRLIFLSIPLRQKLHWFRSFLFIPGLVLSIWAKASRFLLKELFCKGVSVFIFLINTYYYLGSCPGWPCRLTDSTWGLSLLHM